MAKPKKKKAQAKPKKLERPTFPITLTEIRACTTDMGAAWALAEKLEGCRISLIVHEGRAEVNIISDAYDQATGNPKHGASARDASTPLALCAALVKYIDQPPQ